MMKIIAIANNKGGVGKTTTSINLAHVFSQYFKKRVALIDLDPQAGNATSFFAGALQNMRDTVAEVLQYRHSIRRALYHTEYENLDIVPAGKQLEKVYETLDKGAEDGRYEILRAALNEIKEDYDFCIIDNAPAVTVGMRNALVASDEVIVPVNIDYYGFLGLGRMTEIIQEARQQNPGLYFRGCLVTRYAKDESSEDDKSELQAQEDYPVFKTHIRESKKVRSSTFYRAPIAEYSRRCATAIDYIRLGKEILGI